MKSLPRFAPLIAILALLVLVAIGGSALANNTSTPEVDAETATVRLNTGADPGTPADDQPSSQSLTSTVAPNRIQRIRHQRLRILLTRHQSQPRYQRLHTILHQHLLPRYH